MNDNPASAEVPFSRIAPWVFFVAIMFLLNYLNRAMFGPLLSHLEREFFITHAASTGFLFYMSVGYSISLFFSGFTSAIIRPRIMVGGSSILCGGVMIMLSYAESLRIMPLVFLVLGLAAGQYFNGGLSTIRSLVTPAQWSKAISIHEIGPNASFILGPVLAEAGAAYFGWRGVVYGMGCLSLAAGVLFLLFARGGNAPAAKISFRNMGQVLRDKRLWLFTWLMALAIAGEFGPYSVLMLHLVEDRLFSPELSAILLSTSRIAAPFAVLFGGWITMRLGTKQTLKVCLIAYTIGMFLMAMPWTLPLIIGMYVQPALTAMIFPPVFTFLAESFNAKDQPMLLGIGMPIGSFIGVGLMPPILGLWGDYASFNAGFVMMGCLVALSLPMLMAFKQK